MSEAHSDATIASGLLLPQQFTTTESQSNTTASRSYPSSESLFSFKDTGSTTPVMDACTTVTRWADWR